MRIVRERIVKKKIKFNVLIFVTYICREKNQKIDHAKYPEQ